MSNLLKTNGVYGANVGHKTVFTKQGALDRYKACLEVCYNNITMEGAYVLGEMQNDLVKIGFTWDEVEKIEIEYLESLN
jgi:hypothetical protein